MLGDFSRSRHKIGVLVSREGVVRTYVVLLANIVSNPRIELGFSQYPKTHQVKLGQVWVPCSRNSGEHTLERDRSSACHEMLTRAMQPCLSHYNKYIREAKSRKTRQGCNPSEFSVPIPTPPQCIRIRENIPFVFPMGTYTSDLFHLSTNPTK